MVVLAYVDPVSGMFLLQIIMAGVIGSIAFFRKGIGKALSFVLRRSVDNPRE